MGRQNSDKLQGTLDLLILRSLVRGEMHGYGIASHIQRVSEDVLQVEEGSLYPALHRMEQEGWIRSEWKLSGSNRKAKFYGMTPAGKRELAEQERRWEALSRGVARVLKFA